MYFTSNSLATTIILDKFESITELADALPKEFKELCKLGIKTWAGPVYETDEDLLILQDNIIRAQKNVQFYDPQPGDNEYHKNNLESKVSDAKIIFRLAINKSKKVNDQVENSILNQF